MNPSNIIQKLFVPNFWMMSLDVGGAPPVSTNLLKKLSKDFKAIITRCTVPQPIMEKLPKSQFMLFAFRSQIMQMSRLHTYFIGFHYEGKYKNKRHSVYWGNSIKILI